MYFNTVSASYDDAMLEMCRSAELPTLPACSHARSHALTPSN